MAENKDDHLLPQGIRFFNPNEKAPDFVLGDMVITPNDFFAYCKAHPELLTEYDNGKEKKKQIKIQLLVAKSGKLYGKVDDYKSEKVEGRVPKRPGVPGASEPATTSDPAQEADDDLPF